jgi:hypothetical protein
MEQIEQTTTAAPAYSGYRAPAVSIRATYTVGDVTDEVVVDIDQGPVDVAVIRGVIDALTETRDAAIEVEARDVSGPRFGQGGTLPAGVTSITAPKGGITVNSSAADKEAQA